jgi:predicted DsbA family dithiol-disulfide isomerase
VAKAALTVSPEAFEMMHERLLRAYFSENLNITDDENLFEIWQQLALPPQAFERRNDPALRETVFNEHAEAINHGATGVPAYHIRGGVGVLMGAQPLEMLREWINRMRKNM